MEADAGYIWRQIKFDWHEQLLDSLPQKTEYGKKSDLFDQC